MLLQKNGKRLLLHPVGQQSPSAGKPAHKDENQSVGYENHLHFRQYFRKQSLSYQNHGNQSQHAEKISLGNEFFLFFAPFHFLGRVPTADLLYLYNASQMLVLPSYYEGFGLPPLGAMACDIPVIVSDTSVMPEVVGDAALRVAHEDVEGFTVAMWRLLTDHDLRADTVAKGRKRVKCFSWERAARETLEVYQRVAERHNSV